MKANLRLPKVTIELNADSPRELFKEMAAATEVFGESQCGLCKSENIRHVVRMNKEKQSYFEYHCDECGARLSVGQNRDQKNLFPTRELDKQGKPNRKTGKRGKHNGWTMYKGEQKDEDGDEE